MPRDAPATLPLEAPSPHAGHAHVPANSCCPLSSLMDLAGAGLFGLPEEVLQAIAWHFTVIEWARTASVQNCNLLWNLLMLGTDPRSLARGLR